MSIVFEDDPYGSPATCPRQAAVRLGLPCMEPSDVGQLRDAMEQVTRLSRAGRRPAAIVVHRWVLRSADTLEARPNRVLDPVAAAGTRPRRPARWAETGDVLRVGRRLELNRFRSVPSPGELLPVGFIVVGPAVASINHVVHFLGLTGRVPVLELGMVNPIDDSVVQRMLGRCEDVVVLEPRPGSIDADVLRVAESMRRRKEHAAAVSAQPMSREPNPVLRADEALHPSILARKIVPLLHAIRPGLELPFVPDPPTLTPPPSPRGGHLGPTGALAQVRQVLADLDQWLRDHVPRETQDAAELPTALAVDGAEPEGVIGQRVLTVETWTHRRFLTEGIASLRQAAWDDRPWMFVMCAMGDEEVHDLVRLARGAKTDQR